MIIREIRSDETHFRVSETSAQEPKRGMRFWQLDTGVRETAPRILPYIVSYITVLKEISKTISSDQSVNGWVSYIKEKFYSFTQVETIYALIEQDKIDVWIIIPNRDSVLLRKLIETEMGVLDVLSSDNKPLFSLEFHIVYRCGNDERQFVPLRALRLPR